LAIIQSKSTDDYQQRLSEQKTLFYVCKEVISLIRGKVTCHIEGAFEILFWSQNVKI